MIEFSSKGVQTMFLAYIGGLFLIQSENENESTCPKKIRKKYIIRFFTDSDIFLFFQDFSEFFVTF